jgi:riboflavin synthase
MFTGIIQAACPIVATADHSAGRRLTIDLSALTSPTAPDPLQLGESIAVNGVCLTLAAAERGLATFDVITETLRFSTLGRLRPGDRVNIERALKLSDRLGGHLVQGHIDGTAALAARRQSPQETVLEFTASADLLAQMIHKGSIAIDGVSLTLTNVDPPACLFAVALIPTTLALTTLDTLKVGSLVNIETDLIGKWVRRYLSNVGIGECKDFDSGGTGSLSARGNPGRQAASVTQEGSGDVRESAPGLTLDKLREAGFA